MFHQEFICQSSGFAQVPECSLADPLHAALRRRRHQEMSHCMRSTYGRCALWEDLVMKIHLIVMTVIYAVVVSGCATITRGSKDLFEIESDPTGATVDLSNGLHCVTPCAMELPRKHAFTATFSMEGYKPLTIEVVPKQAAAGTAGMAGNIIFGGLVGIVADSTSGAMKDLYPNPLVAKLAPTDSGALSAVVLPEKDAEDDAGKSDGEQQPEGEPSVESDESEVSTSL